MSQLTVQTGRFAAKAKRPKRALVIDKENETTDGIRNVVFFSC